MRVAVSLMLSWLIALAAVSPASARVVVLQATANLEAHTEPALDKAIREALDIVLAGAAEMGLSSIRLDRARVLDDTVTVWVVGTDEDGDDSDEGRTE